MPISILLRVLPTGERRIKRDSEVDPILNMYMEYIYNRKRNTI
jgi:hypothetical protein